MDEIKKMLRAVINGQSALKQELLKRISDLDKRLSKRIDGVESHLNKMDERMNRGFKEVNNRIDKLGSDLAYLEVFF